jgi:LmbE family N-acetylglucosaminyl deacetylase
VKLPRSVLFVGAHCDDIELLAGGLLSAACRAGARVGALVFSDHRGVIADSAAAIARDEFSSNLAWLCEETGASITDHTDLVLPACQGAFEAERGRLYQALAALRDSYDLVVTHPLTDTNQDHQQVALEAVRVFKAHASLLAGEFPNNDLGGSPPAVYVTLADCDLDAKVRMVGAYQSQRFDGRPYLDESVIRALARVRGSQVREPAAEAFSVLGRVVMRGPPQRP